MKIAFFNRSFWPDVESSGQLLTELCEDLSARHEVTVVAGRPYHGKGRLAAWPVRTEWLSSKRGARGATRVRILRAGNTRFGKKRFVGRLANLLTYFAFAFAAGFRLGKPDVIVTETDPPVLGLLGLFFKYWYRCRFVYYCQDIHPDVGLATGRLRHPFWVSLLRAANALIFRCADLSVVVGRDMKDRLVARNVPADRVRVAPNWVDADAVRPRAGANAFRARHGLDHEFVVMYSGNLGLSQGLEKVIDAADLLRDERQVRFLLVGDGASRDRLERLAARRSLDNVMFVPYQPRETLGDSLSAADLHVIPLHRGVAGCIVPSKVYGIMAAGRPFVAATEESSEVARVARECSCGLVIPPEDPAALAETIQWCRANPDRLARMGANGRRAAVERFDRKIAARRFEDVLAACASLPEK